MSHTDKTRPQWVAVADPDNRRFLMIGNFGWPITGEGEWHWKKLTSCHNSNCCYGYLHKHHQGKQRAKLRATLRDALKTAPQDREDFDG